MLVHSLDENHLGALVGGPSYVMHFLSSECALNCALRCAMELTSQCTPYHPQSQCTSNLPSALAGITVVTTATIALDCAPLTDVPVQLQGREMPLLGERVIEALHTHSLSSALAISVHWDNWECTEMTASTLRCSDCC